MSDWSKYLNLHYNNLKVLQYSATTVAKQPNGDLGQKLSVDRPLS